MNDETLKKAAKVIVPVLVFVLIVFLIVRTGSKKEENEAGSGNGMGEKAAQIANQAQLNAAANANSAGADASAGGNTQLANPYVGVTRASDFEATGIMIDAPSGATSISYMILDGTIPVVNFKKGNRTYRYEATKGDEQLSVIYGTEEKSEMIDDATFAMLVSYVDGGTIVTWQKDGVNFFLTCNEPGSSDDTKAVYELLK